MAFRYPKPLHNVACQPMLAGERVEELAEELEVSAASLHC
jgi:hypothetical protein